MLLEYLYTGKLMKCVTGIQVQNLSIVSHELGLTATHEIFDRMCVVIKSKIEDELI
jgi:hypothetical protein